jgi:cytochrome c551/c552
VNTKVLATGCVVALSLLVSGTSAQTGQTGAPRPQTTPAAQASEVLPDTAAQRKMLDQYCVGCHNAKLKTAGLALDTISAEDASNAQTKQVTAAFIPKLHTFSSTFVTWVCL